MAVSERPLNLVAGKYELEQELARGGMGVVYRARDRSTGRVIALKRSLDEHQSSSQLVRTMLQREYQTLVTLRHPHIIQVYDFGVDEVGPYYTMELLDGVDLRAKSPLPWREVCAYLRDIASSLALLHSRRLLHSDVSVGNIYLTCEGRAKLLDFGALATFGKNSVVAGSPPIMPPEVIERQELDQRADLYSLGATAYYALCGRHAYPVTKLALLPAAWERSRPQKPSAHVPDIPRELDELVLSLMDLDRMSRPASAAEVIDRLGAIAGLGPDQDQRVENSYLHSVEVVGRDAERKLLGDKLKQALEGHGGGVLIEGGSGLGASFLLEDLTQRARVAGARVFTVNARAHRGQLGAWSALVREASVPGGRHNSSPPPQSNSEAVFLKLAERTPIVLAIDGLHEADADSWAAYAALAKSVRHAAIMLVATFDPTKVHVDRPALRILSKQLSTIQLRPFDERATQAFVTGLFGEVAAAPRLATFLLNHAAGNPRAYTEVIHHLIAQGLIRYAEGTWILPHEFTTGPGGLELQALVDAAFESRIASWNPALRTLALCLSPHRRVFDLALCQALERGEPELAGKNLQHMLAELVREGVLVEDRGAYAFSGSRVRDVLYARLTPERKLRQHGRIAAALEAIAGNDLSRGFEIGFHLILAGDEAKARAYINKSVAASLTDPDMLIESVPDLWALLEQQRAAGATDEEVQFIEGMLVVSGYYLDPTVQDRFGPRVLPLMHRTLGLALANRLSPWLGRPLAFALGLLGGFVKSLFRRPYLVSGHFMTSLLIFVSVCASASAGACFRLDRNMHTQLLKLTDFARGLPRFDAFRLIHDLFEVGRLVVQGRFAEALAGLEDQQERLPKVALMTAEAQHQYGAGLQFFIGRNQLLRLDSTSLACAERIDALGARHDRLMAHFLRRTYYLYRGDLAAAKQEEERFDAMAASFGSRWTADVMGVLEFVPYHLAGDVVALKRTLHRIERLVTIAPELATYREVIRAMYEGHRGRPDSALHIYASLDAQLAPFTVPIWAVARSHQAECLNVLGRHHEALAVCEAALAQLAPADRVYVFAYQQLERESALAHAGLGRTEEAIQRIQTLLAECIGHGNPVITGLLHCDLTRMACMVKDREAFETHAEAAREAFAGTHNPALAARAKRLLELGRSVGLVETLPSLEEATVADAGRVRDKHAERVIDEVVRSVGATSACLYVMRQGRVLLGAERGDSERVSQLRREVASTLDALTERVREGELDSVVSRARADSTLVRQIIPLVLAADGGAPQLVGLLLLGGCEHSSVLSTLDVEQLASELMEREDDTEVL